MDACRMKQIPLRDTYIPCTEPIHPYHGNYVSISLTKPWILNLPMEINNLWQLQKPYWHVNTTLTEDSSFVTVPQWSDICRNFIMPTYCVRTWGNTGYWWNPTHYDNLYTFPGYSPVTRTARYPEAQIGDLMYMHALLMSLPSTVYRANGNDVRLQYSQYDYNSGTVYGDFYNNNGREYSIPSYTTIPSEYRSVNEIVNHTLHNTYTNGLGRIAGLNLTLFVVEAQIHLPTDPTLCPPNANYLSITLKPLVPYCDISGCYLYRPDNYDTNYMNQEDWDGTSLIETNNGADPNIPETWAETGIVESVLPPITAEFPSTQKCFYVFLPLQLYTATPCAPDFPFTFSLRDFERGSVHGPMSYVTRVGLNMVTVAVRLRGTFLNIEGEPCTAGEAESLQFEITHPENIFTLSHTYQTNRGGSNRPILCTETCSIPILKPGVALPVSTSLLFSPRCGPGMWTNLPRDQPQAGYQWEP